MSVSQNIPDLATLLISLCDVCLAGAFVGCILTLVESAFVLGFGGSRRHGTAAPPPVTILKPLHGAEPDLAARLKAFCRQDYDAPVQVVCGAQDQAAPAVAEARKLQAEMGDSLELVIDPRVHGFNRKISNLINMLPHASHDTLALSDSDIVVGSGYLRTIVALMARPRVGAVTCLYHGIGGKGVWARLSALAINSQFLPQAITAISLRLTKPCFGATVALRRSMLDRIGGFGAFADVLADDYAMGLAVRSAGYEVVTAPFVVGHRCFEGSLRQLLLHELRVARTIKSIDPIGYAGTIITHPWPLALIGMLSGSTAAVLLALAVLASRVTLCRCVERRFGLPRQDYWLIPIHDIIAFSVYVVSFFGATVHWRGSDYRVTADGTLLEDET
jgi:ceramide glucosyltransferase